MRLCCYSAETPAAIPSATFSCAIAAANHMTVPGLALQRSQRNSAHPYMALSLLRPLLFRPAPDLEPLRRTYYVVRDHALSTFGLLVLLALLVQRHTLLVHVIVLDILGLAES